MKRFNVLYRMFNESPVTVKQIKMLIIFFVIVGDISYKKINDRWPLLQTKNENLEGL